ncbi:hypothetical protein TNCV_396531 [Trichonephila clavipes]|nr:hypothetical protein TNCV_396531 [Trichonephila clavipes]
METVKIVCAILNAFHPARLNNIEDDNVTAQQMQDLVKKPNYLQQKIEENGWARKRCKVGATAVGCCAHVASVLRYLGYWRHNNTQTKIPSLGYADTFSPVIFQPVKARMEYNRRHLL